MDQAQCATYLSQGLGRPYLYFQEHDPTPFIDVLLHACLYNPTYDSQCEGSRAAYLHELIQLTPDPSWFRRPILDALGDPDDEMDLEQLFDFALFYARDGHAEARRLLYEQAGEQASTGNSYGADQLIEIDGVAGFLFFANRFGEAMLSDSKLWDDDYLLRLLADTGAQVDDATLRAAAQPNYPFVAAYLDHVAATQAQREQGRQRLSLLEQTYAELRQSIKEHHRRGPFMMLRRWGKAASEEDLLQVAHDLLQETDHDRLATYLSIFDKRAFPLGFEPLLPLVWSEHERVSRWSLQAIGQFQHPAVRELGFTLIQKQHHVDDALDIFVHNFQSGDERYLAALLTQTQDVDQLHGMGFGISDIFAQNPTPAAADLLIDLYERGPCSLCRARFVQRLIEIDSVPEWMRHEALHDADPKIREAIRVYLQR